MQYIIRFYLPKLRNSRTCINIFHCHTVYDVCGVVRKAKEDAVVSGLGGKLSAFILRLGVAYPIDGKSRLRLIRPLERIKKIRQIVEKENPDMIISFLADVNVHVLIACSNMNYPIIVSERNDPNKSPKSKCITQL